jgi:HTH-type transcriptional regulator/antitoxin HigA
MNIRPVNSEQAYDEAIERIETLWGAESGTPEGDELDVLLTLVRVYEKENHPVPPPTPIEAIRFVMDQRGMKQADLVPYIGSRSKVSEVLRGKRTLSLLNKKGEPIIALSLRYDRLDNFWFTLTHGLAHLALGHAHSVEGQCIIDDLDLREP